MNQIHTTSFKKIKFLYININVYVCAGFFGEGGGGVIVGKAFNLKFKNSLY